MIAQWQFDAKFGYKQQAIDLLKQWNEQFGAKIGWTSDKVRLLSAVHTLNFVNERQKAELTVLVYFKRTRVWAVGTGQIRPPLPNRRWGPSSFTRNLP